MLRTTMLLVSRDVTLIEAVRGAIRSIDHLDLEVVDGVGEARSLADREDVGLVVMHAAGEGADVERLLRAVAALGRPVASLVLAEQHRPEQALAALRLGAADYLGRPLDLGRLSYLIDVLTVRARHRPATAAAADAREPFFYYASHEMGKLMEQVRRVASLDTTVLLSGETGTGKTRLARLVHELSPRRGEPFLVVNCGALSTNLIESEMFGHVRGAFTGADRDRRGKFAEVGRGTLFLDEIDSLPAEVQAKLLRVVEERVFEAVGSNKSQPVHARLIAACNRDLDREVAAGRFRTDLYYRLNVVGFTIPPLRDRPQAVGPLAHRFVNEFAARNGCKIRGIGDEAMACLEAHDWPGNIRELRNVIERAVALCLDSDIGPDDLPEAIAREAPRPAEPLAVVPASPCDSTLAEIRGRAELSRITQALEKHRHNRLRAAGELGISRMTLYKKLYKYGLMDDDLKAYRGSGAGGAA